MKKIYKVTLKSGESFIGNAKAIATQMRDSSKMEQGISVRQYVRNYAKRHGIVYGSKLPTINYDKFVRSFLYSPMVRELVVIEKSKNKGAKHGG